MALPSNPQVTTREINQLPQTISSAAELLGALLEVEKRLASGAYQSAKLPLGVLFQGLNQQLAGPNDRRDLRKAVRCYDTRTPGYNAGDSTLTGLNQEYISLHTVCTVEFGPDGYDVEYEVRYDPTGPLRVYLDGRFTGAKLEGRWFRLGSEEAAMANIPLFHAYAASGYPTVGTTVRQTIAGADRLFVSLQAMPLPVPAQGYPVPSGTGPTAFWKEVAPPTTPTALYQRLSSTQARALQNEEEVYPNRLYEITPAPLVLQAGQEPPPDNGIGSRKILTTGLFDGISFSPVAVRVEADGTFTPGRYTLTDTEESFVAAGEGDITRYVGQPANNNIALGANGFNDITSGQDHFIAGGQGNLISSPDNACSILNSFDCSITHGALNHIYGSTNCLIGPGCEAVLLLNCSNFNVPDNTGYKTYINNQLSTAGGNQLTAVQLAGVQHLSGGLGRAATEASVANLFLYATPANSEGILQLDPDWTIYAVGLVARNISGPLSITQGGTGQVLFDGDVSDPVTPFALLAGSSYTVVFEKTIRSAEASLIFVAGGVGGTSSVPSGAIDYQNPITLTAAATLQTGKSYRLTGSGYALTLPDAAQTIGSRLFLSVTAAATGLYPLAGSGYVLQAAETAELLATGDGWKQIGGDTVKTSLTVATTTSGTISLVANGGLDVPFSVVQERVGEVELVGNTITVRRAAKANLLSSTNLQSAAVGGFYQVTINLVRNGQRTVKAIGKVDPSAINNDTYGFLTMPATVNVLPDDQLYVEIYSSAGGRLRNDQPTQPNTFTYNEA